MYLNATLRHHLPSSFSHLGPSTSFLSVYPCYLSWHHPYVFSTFFHAHCIVNMYNLFSLCCVVSYLLILTVALEICSRYMIVLDKFYSNHYIPQRTRNTINDKRSKYITLQCLPQSSPSKRLPGAVLHHVLVLIVPTSSLLLLPLELRSQLVALPGKASVSNQF